MADTDRAAATRPAAERGSLVLRTHALERVAEHAAGRVTGTLARDRSLTSLHRYPRASVDLKGSTSWITLDVAASWPCRVADVARSVQEAVRAEAARWSGTSVAGVDVTVHVLTPDDDTPTPRRVQ